MLGGRNTSFTFTTLRMRAMTLQTQVAANTLAMALALEPIPPPTCKDSPSPQLTPHGRIRDFPLSNNEAIFWCMAALSMEEDNIHGLLWTHSSRAVGYTATLSIPSLEDFQHSFFSPAFSPAAPQVPLCLDPSPLSCSSSCLAGKSASSFIAASLGEAQPWIAGLPNWEQDCGLAV